MIVVVVMWIFYELLRIVNVCLLYFFEWVNIYCFYYCKYCVINNCFKVLVYWLLRFYVYLYLVISIYLENKLLIYYMFIGVDFCLLFVYICLLCNVNIRECMNCIIMVFIRYVYMLMLYMI